MSTCNNKVNNDEITSITCLACTWNFLLAEYSRVSALIYLKSVLRNLSPAASG